MMVESLEIDDVMAGGGADALPPTFLPLSQQQTDNISEPEQNSPQQPQENEGEEVRADSAETPTESNDEQPEEEKKKRGILKYERNYSNKHVDFEPKIEFIPYDEEKDRTIEIQIVKEIKKVVSYRALFLQKKEEEEKKRREEEAKEKEKENRKKKGKRKRKKKSDKEGEKKIEGEEDKVGEETEEKCEVSGESSGSEEEDEDECKEVTSNGANSTVKILDDEVQTNPECTNSNGVQSQFIGENTAGRENKPEVVLENGHENMVEIVEKKGEDSKNMDVVHKLENNFQEKNNIVNGILEEFTQNPQEKSDECNKIMGIQNGLIKYDKSLEFIHKQDRIIEPEQLTNRNTEDHIKAN